MAEVQTAYIENPPIGFPGMLANGEAHRSISRTVEDSAGIAYGKFVFRGAADHGCTATPTANKVLGVVIADHGKGMVATGTPDVVGQYGTLSIATTEPIFVTAGAAVVQGDPVYVTSAGAITNVSTSNVATGWTFDTSAASGAPAVVVKR
jgi:hypothetical protein